MKRHISLTHVEYEQGDLIGKFLALSSLVPVLLVFSLFLMFYVHRRLATGYLMLGLLLNEGLSLESCGNSRYNFSEK